MFNCCSSKKILENVITSISIQDPKINLQKLSNRVILNTDPPKPMPPPTPPTSQPLTKNEIELIKTNLSRIMDFNFHVNVQQGQVINDVFYRLQGSQYKISDDLDKDSFWSILEGSLAVAAVITEVAIVEIIFVIIIGAIQYVNDNSETFNNNCHVNLDDDAANLLERVNLNYNANQIYIGNMFDDPNTYRDQEFTLNDKKYTLRSLIDKSAPESASTLFNSMVRLVCRQFRNKITIPEMIKMQFYDIYFVEERERHLRLGCAFAPEQYESGIDLQRSRLFNKENVGNNIRIFSNDEIRKWNPDYTYIQAYGTSDDDLKSSYLNAINFFINGNPSKKQPGFPASFVHPWTVTNVSVYSNRWYLLEGSEKITRPTQHFGVANGEFMKWLFIDDGAGNVINPEGIMYRYDILESGILGNGNSIPKENIIPDNEQILFKSTDYQYMYPGCSENVKSNRVYTGDFYGYIN